MSQNREVKSDVFSMLMEDKRNALQVYNALNGSDYTNPELVEMQTLEKGISLSKRNDAAFIVDMNLEIYEHQSTYNPNMSLRSLIYMAEIIKKLVKDEDIFGRKLIKLPNPHFVVFYNGKENRAAVETLRLSDAYQDNAEEPMLELICTVYNINPGKNNEFLSKCSILWQYTQFIEKVREYEKSDVEEPITEAIDWCLKHDILAEFLKARRQEVIKAMTLDMTWEHREEIIRRDERAQGRAEGEVVGITKGILQGRSEGIRLIVKNMLSLEKTPDEIAELTGIGLQEVNQMINAMSKE